MDSDIQFRKELPLFVFNCFEWFKRGAEPVTQCAPGKPLAIPVADPAWKSILVFPPGANAAPQRVPVPAGAESVNFYDSFQPGIYGYMGDTEKNAARGFAVFFGSPGESDLSVAAQLKIGPRDEKGQVVENRLLEEGPEAALRVSLSGQLWLYFLWAAFFVLLAENYFFHRRVFF